MIGHRGSQRVYEHAGGKKHMTRVEYVLVMVDDYSRLAHAEVLPDLTARSAIRFLHQAVRWFADRGVQIEAVMSDNGSAYRALAHRKALAELGLKHLRIKPYRPRTNGKAERCIQTLLNEWAYARIYGSSRERTNALPIFLERYNYRRPQAPPVTNPRHHD